MSSQFPSRAETREDGYNAARRGDVEKDVDEGFYAEENPALMQMIDNAKNAAEARGQKEKSLDDLRGDDTKRLWYEVRGRGDVGFAVGDAETKHVDEVVDDDLEALRALRLNQIKAQAARQEEWRRKGHGIYSELHSDTEFFEEARKHDRMICALVDENRKVDASLLHGHLQRIAPLHLEAKLCSIAVDKAPLLCTHVELDHIPVLFLMRGGKVVDTFNVDRSFTTEVSRPRFVCPRLVRTGFTCPCGCSGDRLRAFGARLPRLRRNHVQVGCECRRPSVDDKVRWRRCRSGASATSRRR